MKRKIKSKKTIVILYRKFFRIKIIILSMISPTYATKVLYKKRFKKKLDLNNPKTFNEKILWLKLNTYNNNNLVTQCADKFQVRQYVESRGFGDTLNKLIDVWDSVDKINWELLPNKFAMKINHGAGYNIICNNKANLDVKKSKGLLEKWMKEDYWKLHAEINYKHIPKRIICEKFIENEKGMLPDDYKIYCFNGQAEFVMLCIGREVGRPEFYFFDREWNMMPYTNDALDNPNIKIEKPKGIDKMFGYAEELAKPFPFVRADFYLDNGTTIFGELTFTPSGGLDTNMLSKTDVILGDLLRLPKEDYSNYK